MAETDREGSTRNSFVSPSACAFPPALIPILRERFGGVVDIGDEVLSELLTTVFFAGLQTHEGSYYPVRVAFAGRIVADVLLPGGEESSATPMLVYRWSTLRFEPDRAFCASELVKLGVVTRSEKVFTKVVLSDRGLRVTGLAREGLNRDGDPYLEVIAPRPGVLSIRCGRQRLIDYEHGMIVDGARDVVLARGAVRDALEAAARNAGVDDVALGDYLDTVRKLVGAMAAHGKGGILVISGESHPELPAKASFRTRSDFAIAELFQFLDSATVARRSDPAPISQRRGVTELRRALQGAFSREVERRVSEVGGLTAMDGATVLDCGLGLRGFGVVLPVTRDIDVVEAQDPDAESVDAYDLSRRGTRHRAAASYAKRYPGSVVFVASHDGPVNCVLRDPQSDRVILWRLGLAEFL